MLERVWRVEGREQDAKEALDIFTAAARQTTAPGACEAALDAARLRGDLSHDAVSTYAELYRAERRFPTAPCARDAADALTVLAAFRPPQRVLEAIDEDLVGEGATVTGVSTNDAGLIPLKAPQITRIDAWPGRDASRVVIVLDRPANYRVSDEAGAGGPGASAPRTTVDFDGVDLATTVSDLRADGVVTRVHGEGTTTGSRVVLELDGRPWRRVFPMQEPYRLVIDIARNPPGGHATESGRAVTRVVLDPGHGGKDAGAMGPNGVREKDVTLDVAHRVAPVLAAQGLQVVLTRDDDRFVSLEERTARANAFGADLFISIHCNASESKLRRGVETYVLDTTRDEIAARVAARENATTQAASAALASILGSMRMADDARRSTRFAQLLQRASTAAVQSRYGDVVDGGVHTAGFYVLVGARMPSVLFETSYVSNPSEESRLGSPEYRQLLADAILNAVKAYRQGR
jgi:N-acetylmuramoyl-L-alanine amidase